MKDFRSFILGSFAAGFLFCYPGQSHSAPPMGDGVIVDSVSQDVYCIFGELAPCRSALVDKLLLFKQNPSLHNKITYFFPDFMSIEDPTPANPNPYKNFNPKAPENSIQSACPQDGKKDPTRFINDVSYPVVWADENPQLGACIPGYQVTQTYHSFNNSNAAPSLVMPMVNGTADLINKPVDGANTLNNIADALAAVVKGSSVSDRNIAGLSFDLENESLGDENPQNASQFLLRLSNAIGPDKYIAIFDGETLARYMLSKGITIPDNVFLLHALYDGGIINDGTIKPGCPRPAHWSIDNPYTPAQYQKCGVSPDGFFVKPEGNVRVMFVLPAAATMQLYESIEVMNTSVIDSINTQNHGLKPEQLPVSDAGDDDNLLQNPNCYGANEVDTSRYVAKTNCLIPSQKDQAQFYASGSYRCEVHPEMTDEWYFGAQNCKRYDSYILSNGTQTPIHQEDYVAVALNKVAMAAVNHPNYLGVVLYNEKPSSETADGFTSTGFNSVNCAKQFFSTLGDYSLVKRCLVTYPESITDGVWKTYNTWDKNPNIFGAF